MNFALLLASKISGGFVRVRMPVSDAQRGRQVHLAHVRRQLGATVVLALDILLAADVLDALSQPIDEVAFATLYKISIVVVARTVLAITLGAELGKLEDALAQEQAALAR